ncbi:hypothetical protein KSP39_PZI010594 [Platanthera zijinensis]|uniref:Uncharacterized protein n=1 Tax=Platanthera zijinensis TaxID=2320716 RepID=A0AAP0G6V0_9ASPA
MGQRSCLEESAEILLEQFELILDHHMPIDEVGFVHPSQFAELHEDSSISWSPPAKYWQILDKACRTDGSGLNCPGNVAVFWYGNHKLAISMQVVPLLYNAALLAHIGAQGRYKRSINTPKYTSSLHTATCEAQYLETDILKHSRAILILSPDFGSVWNSRKLVLSREHDLSLFIEELNLSTLILSYSPKSEQAWCHRRWLIKQIAEKFHDLYDIIDKDSELVKTIAENSKMNYRAWSHRCWLITHMTKGQMFDELKKSRKWAELHVADNSCYHYRRRLIHNLLENSLLKDNKERPSGYKCHSFNLLKEELNWNVHLIKLYMGREALWVHRRFLSYYFIKHVTNPIDLGFPCEVQKGMIHSVDCFLGEERELLLTCLTIPSHEFSDTVAQAQHAATYMLWMSKEIILPQECRFQEKLKEIGDLKTILINTWPGRTVIWESLLDQLPTEVQECQICGADSS